MEKLERASRFRTRSHILSPPISPTSRSPAHHPRPRDRREDSPARRQSAPVVKDEPGSNPDFMAVHGLPADASFPSSMSVSNVETVQHPPSSRISMADAVSQAFNQVPSPWRCHHPPSCPRTRLPIFAPNNATCSRRWKEYVPTRPGPTGGASAAQTRSSWCAAVPPSEVDTDKGRMIGTPARPTTQCSDLTGGVLNRQRPCRGLWISWSA